LGIERLGQLLRKYTFLSLKLKVLTPIICFNYSSFDGFNLLQLVVE